MTQQTLYYVQFDDEYFGPFAFETIVDMSLTPEVLVLSTKTNEWKQACEYVELIDSLDLSLYEINEDESIKQQPETFEAPNSYEEFSGNSDRVSPSFNEQTIFYIRRDGNPYGPYNLEALASTTITEHTDISVDGMVSWYKIYEISGLLNTIAAISNQRYTDREPEPEQSKSDNNEEVAIILNRIQGLIPGKKNVFRRVFETTEKERDFIISEYNRVFNTLLNLIKSLSENCHNSSLNHRAIFVVIDTVNSVVEKINNYYLQELERLDVNRNEFTISSVVISKTKFSLLSPLEDVNISRLDFLSILGDKNLCVTYDATSEEDAFDFVNNIIARLYESNPARLIETEVIDADFMTGLNDSFKLLNRELYRVISRTDDIRNTLTKLQDRAGIILRNLLVEKGSTLQDYNSLHENKEANILLVLKNFPKGLTHENLEAVNKLSIVGPKSGIYVIMLTSNDSIYRMTDKEKESLSIDKFKETANNFNFSDSDILDILKSDDSNEFVEGDINYNKITESEIKNIVKQINAKCELKKDVIISISDYLPERSEWWSFDSARQIEIPFGMGNDMHIKSLKITQESGQNTAVVIGIPGSGKSVFLHSLICGAAIKYSPDELRMYLIDFSGVEFNSYAIGKLPHARVIAPEAEREFGLSILNELVEEGSRRMSLCRDYNVSNIVDLKKVAPEVKVPRLLVIIDEFQKFFEVDNDRISKEANSKIHIIIQEFRKFGINLILATQKLPTGSLLPRDLIANRVVFKSAPNDFDSLITTETRNGIPRLRTGQCVYNSESGASYANEIVQGFFTSKSDLESLLASISDFESKYSYVREPLKVFRSDELPIFENRRVAEEHKEVSLIPYQVPVYFGESIAVSDVDVNVELVKENANNILIIGGEAEVSSNIAFNAMRSCVACHTEETAKVVVLNGMRANIPLNEKLREFSENTPCDDYTIASINSEIETTLKSLKEEIDLRRNDDNIPQQHIYVTCFDYQSIRALDKEMSGPVSKPSQAGKDLDYIIRNGASVGVFVIVQTDTLESLNRVSQTSVLSMFNFRVALQMTEDMSYKIIGSPHANQLFVFNRPSSRFRGYVIDNARNLTIKFKPYK